MKKTWIFFKEGGVQEGELFGFQGLGTGDMGPGKENRIKRAVFSVVTIHHFRATCVGPFLLKAIAV